MFYDKDSNRILWVDWLKAIAITFVLLTHAASPYMENLFLSPTWYIGVGFKSLATSAVALFIMASGFLILKSPEPVSNIPRRFKRVFIPFAFWLLIYLIYLYFLKMGKTDLLGFTVFCLNGFLNPTDANLLFWFVYMIMGLYLFAPILSKWINNSPLSELKYFIAVWTVVMLIQFTTTLTGYNTIISDYLIYFSGSIGYFILGYYLAFKNDSKYINSRKFGLLLWILGFSMGFICTTILSCIKGVPTYTFLIHGDYSPNALLQAIGLFIMIKNTDFSKLSDKINEIVVLISLSSYGCYLTHAIFMGICVFGIPLFTIDNIHLYNVAAIVIIPLMVILVLIVTTAVLVIMSKIPFFKNFTGFKLPSSKKSN